MIKIQTFFRKSTLLASALFLASCGTTQKKIQPQKTSFSNSRYNGTTCALTFDDGPFDHDRKTLKILKKYNIKATFFIVSSRIPGRNKTFQMIKNSGNTIGSHSENHPNYRHISPSKQRQDIDQSIATLKKYGVDIQLFRYPYGAHTPFSDLYLKNKGIRTIYWNVDAIDYRKATPQTIYNRVMAGTAHHKNSVILMHSFSHESTAALPQIIEGLKARGCRFVTL